MWRPPKPSFLCIKANSCITGGLISSSAGQPSIVSHHSNKFCSTTGPDSIPNIPRIHQDQHHFSDGKGGRTKFGVLHQLCARNEATRKEKSLHPLKIVTPPKNRYTPSNLWFFTFKRSQGTSLCKGGCIRICVLSPPRLFPNRLEIKKFIT